MKITIDGESFNIKPSEWQWVGEIKELGRYGKIGDFSRRVWTETDKSIVREWWKEAPVWFKKAAGPILGGKFTPKPKPKQATHSDLIMEAIDIAYKTSLHK